MSQRIRVSLSIALLSAALNMVTASAGISQTLSGDGLVAALRQGGYVVVMRHASSPRETPTKQDANKDNVNVERQLDENGRNSATAMGKAMRDLKIPIGSVLSSPTYRALETVRYAQWANPQTHPELGDRGQSMQGVSETDGMWIRAQTTKASAGTNTFLVTHMPNISRAFPQEASTADGEMLVFRPDGKGGASLVGRIKIEDWPRLAANTK